MQVVSHLPRIAGGKERKEGGEEEKRAKTRRYPGGRRQGHVGQLLYGSAVRSLDRGRGGENAEICTDALNTVSSFALSPRVWTDTRKSRHCAARLSTCQHVMLPQA